MGHSEDTSRFLESRSVKEFLPLIVGPSRVALSGTLECRASSSGQPFLNVSMRSCCKLTAVGFRDGFGLAFAEADCHPKDGVRGRATRRQVQSSPRKPSLGAWVYFLWGFQFFQSFKEETGIFWLRLVSFSIFSWILVAVSLMMCPVKTGTGSFSMTNTAIRS